MEGHRDFFRLWAGDGAKYWLRVLTEVLNRGVVDVWWWCVCGCLAGLPDAIGTSWLSGITQTCIVQLLRNSFGYAGRQHGATITAALSPSAPP